MFQLVPVFLGLFDSTVQKLMNGFRDIFYELAYSNLSNMLSDLNEKVGTISTELSTAPDAWQGGTIWSLIVKIAEQVALPVAGTVFTFVILWELISMLVQPNNLADVDFVSVLMKWLIKSVVAAWFISNSLTICNCFFGVGASMVSKTTTVLNQQVTDNTQDSVLLKYLSDNYGDQDEDAESGDVSGLISLTVSTWFIDIIIKVMGILITIVLYSRMISIYLHCAVAPLPMATVTNHHMSNIGIGYMKNVFALAMQAVLMMICVAIYGVLVANVFDGQQYFLVIDMSAAYSDDDGVDTTHGNGTVYFLTSVSNDNLLNFVDSDEQTLPHNSVAQGNNINTEEVTPDMDESTTEETTEDATKTDADKKESKGLGNWLYIIIFGVVAVVVVGVKMAGGKKGKPEASDDSMYGEKDETEDEESDYDEEDE